MQGAWPPVPARHIARPERGAGRDEGVRAADWDEGMRAADALVDSGSDLVVVAGGGDRGPALSVLAALLGLEPAAAVGTSSTAGWSKAVASVRTGLRAARPHLTDVEALLDAVGAGQVAGAAGLLAQCAVRRTPVLLSAAPDALAAAVVAERQAPGTARWLLVGCSPAGGAGPAALADLGVQPVLDLGLDLPEGAELALAVLQTAIPLAGQPPVWQSPVWQSPAGQPPMGRLPSVDPRA